MYAFIAKGTFTPLLKAFDTEMLTLKIVERFETYRKAEKLTELTLEDWLADYETVHIELTPVDLTFPEIEYDRPADRRKNERAARKAAERAAKDQGNARP